MPIPDQARVEAILQPHIDALVATITAAWDRWWRNPERPLLNRRTRACLVHNYIMLDAVPGLPCAEIKAIEGQETAVFLISDEVVIRFKKGDERGMSSNIGTQTALDYNDPNECYPLLNLPDLMRVDVAYVLNDLETKIQDVLVVARDNERVAWKYSIMLADTAEAPTPLPVDPIQPPPADSGMRLPEAEDAKKQKKDGTE
jgi:hypothetical protein